MTEHSQAGNSVSADLLERARYHAGTAEEELERGDHTGDFAKATAHACLASFYLAEAIMAPTIEAMS